MKLDDDVGCTAVDVRREKVVLLLTRSVYKWL